MKIGPDAGPPWIESQLPAEIISNIVHHIARFSAPTRTLWSCCLVSRDWYGAAISHLYKHPHLVNRNFDLFARTVCPPVGAHIRNVGLEGFVQRLDMGGLAYESSNSLTARLIGRVAPTLEYFVAPPVSLGVSGLAPLSRCEQLKLLDLSRVYHSLDIRKLMKAVSKMNALAVLNLPDAAAPPSDGWLEVDILPPNLIELQLPGWLLQGTHLTSLASSWPHSLAELTIRHCRTCPLLIDRATDFMITAPSIKTLTLHDSNCSNGQIRWLRLFTTFPNLLNLTLPAGSVRYARPEMTRLDVPLESLELTPTEGDVDYWSEMYVRKEDLLQCINNLPHLWQVLVDERCICRTVGRYQSNHDIEAQDELGLEDVEDQDELTRPLKQRAEAKNRSAGYEEVDLGEAGFFLVAG